MPAHSHVPTATSCAQVEALAGYGVQYIELARFVGVSLPTLRKYYRRELDAGTVRANAAVAGTLFKLATEGNVTACIFWLKVRAGWREKAPEQDAPPLVDDPDPEV